MQPDRVETNGVTGHELHRNDWPVILDEIARHAADGNSGGDVQRVTAG